MTWQLFLFHRPQLVSCPVIVQGHLPPEIHWINLQEHPRQSGHMCTTEASFLVSILNMWSIIIVYWCNALTLNWNRICQNATDWYFTTFSCLLHFHFPLLCVDSFWDFMRQILDLSFRVLEQDGVYYTQVGTFTQYCGWLWLTASDCKQKALFRPNIAQILFEVSAVSVLVQLTIEREYIYKALKDQRRPAMQECLFHAWILGAPVVYMCYSRELNSPGAFLERTTNSTIYVRYVFHLLCLLHRETVSVPSQH